MERHWKRPVRETGMPGNQKASARITGTVRMKNRTEHGCWWGQESGSTNEQRDCVWWADDSRIRIVGLRDKEIMACGGMVSANSLQPMPPAQRHMSVTWAFRKLHPQEEPGFHYVRKVMEIRARQRNPWISEGVEGGSMGIFQNLWQSSEAEKEQPSQRVFSQWLTPAERWPYPLGNEQMRLSVERIGRRACLDSSRSPLVKAESLTQTLIVRAPPPSSAPSRERSVCLCEVEG